MELLNRRLQLLEPWLAGGKVASQLTSTTGDVSAAVMYVDRARLLIPLKSPGDASGRYVELSERNVDDISRARRLGI